MVREQRDRESSRVARLGDQSGHETEEVSTAQGWCLRQGSWEKHDQEVYSKELTPRL
jgi:hypothetical protein